MSKEQFSIFFIHSVIPPLSYSISSLFSNILMHSSVAYAFADIISVILFVLLLSYAVSIAMFAVSLNLMEQYSVAYLTLMVSILNLLTQLIIYCAFSEKLTNDLLSTSDHFSGLYWYRMPVRIQKVIILPILRTQREFRLTGLGIVECSLRVFASASFPYLKNSMKILLATAIY